MDEELGRIVHCVTSCWPEFNFSVNDINGKKPMTGERFRELLYLFLQGFIGDNYHLPGVRYLTFNPSLSDRLIILVHQVNLAEYSRNPEMHAHMENQLSLYREINQLLKELGYMRLAFIDLIRPNPATVREVLVILVNFLAFFEDQEESKQMVEEDVIKQKHSAAANEKRLVDEERLLGKSKASAEEQRMREAELKQHIGQRKEKVAKVEGSVRKLEAEGDEIFKRVQAARMRKDQAGLALKQVEEKRDKAAEAVVPDPEALEADLIKSRTSKESLEEDFKFLKDRLPVLEQQLEERRTRVQEHKDNSQRMMLVKGRESKVRAERTKVDAEVRLAGEECQALRGQLDTEKNMIESRKRMLDESTANIEQLRAQLEKIRSDLKQ